MKKSSSWLFITLIAIIGVVFIDGFIRFFLVKNIEHDADLINNLGIIRGSVQRISKLETNNVIRDDLIRLVDKKFQDYSPEDQDLGLNSTRYGINFAKLKNSWNEFKETLQNYREKPAVEAKAALLAKSEEMWDAANALVLEAQLISEMKLKYYQLFLFSTVINILLLFLIIIFVKRYVRDKLELMAIYDPLTKAFNRNYLKEFLENEIKRVERKSRDLSLILWDIDHFKKINDTYGHDVGDLTLLELTRIVKNSIRKYDVFARFGGEEFIIVLPETDIQAAEMLAERVRKDVEAFKFKKIGHITISLGVTSFSIGDSEETMTKRADIALYKAKNNGRNRVELEIF
ncbi:MAG: GGDEF domain-containing protein [Clostridia bacterium]|nr:GGDEF domain-containing protein [Clostridia bacterium]